MMRNRRCVPAAVAVACLLITGQAFGDEFSRKGHYLAGNVSYGIQFLDTSGLSVFRQPRQPYSVDDSLGFNLRYGQRLQSWFALELEYEWMKGFEIAQADGVVIGTYDPDVVTLNGRFILPFWRTHPYLLVGGGLITYEMTFEPNFAVFNVSGSGFAFRTGGGVEVYLTKHIVVNAEATFLINTDRFELAKAPAIEDLYYLSISGGLAYRF